MESDESSNSNEVQADEDEEYKQQEIKLNKYKIYKYPQCKIKMHTSLIDKNKKFLKNYKGLRYQKQKNCNIYQNSEDIYKTRSKIQKQNSIFETLVPNSYQLLDYASSPVYNCTFNKMGDKLFIFTQEGLQIFDVGFHFDKWKETHRIQATPIYWTITDSDISDNNKFLIHSTLNSTLSIFDLEKNRYVNRIDLDEDDEDSSDEDNYFFWQSKTRIYSVKISINNNEIVSGTGYNSVKKGAYIRIFDLEKNKLKEDIKAHENDINSICFADKQNSNIIISGSDDMFCKLFDTRIEKKEVGAFVGHLAGITYVTSREDNIYFASNCKDQSIKLWDLRKFETNAPKKYPGIKFDYRYQHAPQAQLQKLRELQTNNKLLDSSVMTFTGHNVYQTLLRCHFSSKNTTNSRYIYTGSHNGNVYIYDLYTNELVAQYDILEQDVIRDLIMHPNQMSIIITDLGRGIHKLDYKT